MDSWTERSHQRSTIARHPRAALEILRPRPLQERHHHLRTGERAENARHPPGLGAGLEQKGHLGDPQQRNRATPRVRRRVSEPEHVGRHVPGGGRQARDGHASVPDLQRGPTEAEAPGQNQPGLLRLDGDHGDGQQPGNRLGPNPRRRMVTGRHRLHAEPQRRRARVPLGRHAQHRRPGDIRPHADVRPAALLVRHGQRKPKGLLERLQAVPADVRRSPDAQLRAGLGLVLLDLENRERRPVVLDARHAGRYFT